MRQSFLLQVLFFAFVVNGILCIIVTDPPPTSTEYNYWYDIVDPSTGDTKSLYEVRQGGVVKGSYSVLDPDGTKRTVDYTADSKYGFKAIVRNEPITQNDLNKRHMNYNPNNVHISGGNGYIYPVPYIKRVLQPNFFLDNFVNNQATYFTPGNDTSSERLNFNKGEYFRPIYNLRD
ncbi:unnamed protein product [Euphydryas editha]|uniref:Uncharacterized protein n=1 Tax=Euphydryas editha TaxID=104508 RepID=A0AAU9U8E5_EUPED|nr:unnamed protein product [Euphydryas editha]